MFEKHRVVLTCWDYGNPNKPYTDNLSVLFDSYEAAKSAIIKSVTDELETLNEGRPLVPITDSAGKVVSYDNNFRADENGEHENIIRFWDGDDYQEVTHYDVYPIQFQPLSDGLYSCDYRGFTVNADSVRNSFRVECNNVTLVIKDTLQDALKYLDDYSLKLELSKTNNCLPATYVSIWDTGAELIFPCMVNMNTGEVFDIECDPEVLDDFDVLQGEMIYLRDGKQHPLCSKSCLTSNDTSFWYNDTDSLEVSSITGKIHTFTYEKDNDKYKLSLDKQIELAYTRVAEPQLTSSKGKGTRDLRNPI